MIFSIVVLLGLVIVLAALLWHSCEDYNDLRKNYGTRLDELNRGQCEIDTLKSANTHLNKIIDTISETIKANDPKH